MPLVYIPSHCASPVSMVDDDIAAAAAASTAASMTSPLPRAPKTARVEEVEDARPVSVYPTEKGGTLVKATIPRQPPHKSPVAFALDASDSMRINNNIGTVRKTMLGIVEHLRLGTPVCIVAFATSVQSFLSTASLTEEERERALLRIQGLYTGGTTNLHAGLQAVSEWIATLGNPDDANTLVLTDGDANTGETVDPARLASTIPAEGFGAIHAVMFTAASDHRFAAKVKEANDCNTAHFVVSADDLGAKLTNVTEAMFATHLTIAVGDEKRVIPQSSVLPTNFVVFPNADPTSDPTITVTLGGNPPVTIASDAYSKLLATNLAPSMIHLHACAAATYDRLAKINNEVHKEAAKPDEEQDWEVILGTEEACATLEEPDELLAQLKDLAVATGTGDDEAKEVKRSLDVLESHAKELREVRADCMGTGAPPPPPPTVPIFEDIMPMPPVKSEIVSFDDLSAAEEGEGDEMPCYRSLGNDVMSDVNSEAAKAVAEQNREIKARNRAARSEYDRKLEQYRNATHGVVDPKGSLKHHLVALSKMVIVR